MPQLGKANRLKTRYKIPCTRCGMNHATWQHGKTTQEQEQQLRTRANNPRDLLRGFASVIADATY